MSACLTTWARTTTCHGVKELLDSKKIQVKIFWLAVLLAAFGGICYYEKILVTTFLSVPTVTRISHVDVNQLEFPIVTLCNDNVYSLMKFLKKWEEVKQIFTAIRNGYGNEIAFLAYFSWAPLYYRNKMFNRSGYTIVEVEEFEILFNKSVDINPFSKIDLMEFLKTTSYDCYDIFKQLGDCKFGLTTFDCCANANLVQSNIGNCYEINPESLDRSISLKASQLFPGLNQGLHLVVTYNMSDSIPLSPLQSQTIGYYISIGD